MDFIIGFLKATKKPDSVWENFIY